MTELEELKAKVQKLEEELHLSTDELLERIKRLESLVTPEEK